MQYHQALYSLLSSRVDHWFENSLDFYKSFKESLHIWKVQDPFLVGLLFAVVVAESVVLFRIEL